MFRFSLILLLTFLSLLLLSSHVGFGQTASAPTEGHRLAQAPSRFAKLEVAELATTGKKTGSTLIKIHYKVLGKGANPVVFVHGWTCSLNFWSRAADLLPLQQPAVFIDLPGHGKSAKPPCAYTMDLFAEAVDAVLRQAKISQATLVGHSMGTPVIRQFYRKHPEKTAGLVIVDGALRPFGPKETMDKFLAPLRGPNYPEVATRFIEGMLSPTMPAELKAEIKSAMLATPQHVAVSAMEGMAAPEIWKEDTISVPVLAILAKSPFWAPDTESFYRKTAPQLDFQMWDGVSHFLMMEEPEKFTRTLAGFLPKVHSRSTPLPRK
ncbi:MAG: alpha/beta hydrolase [Blastocatellia bacterium]|nr:alpha/beta hydrolase [Blastocatellia bacterium]